MRNTTTLLPALLLLAVAPAHAESFTVHGRNNCHASGPANGVVRTLGAGTHYVTLSGAVSYWSSDWENGGQTWITYVRVHVLDTGEIHNFNSGSGWEPTAAAAEAAVAGTVFQFDLAASGDVSFVVNDGGGCGDNRGGVVVTLDDPAVAGEARSWSALKSAYR